MTKQPKRQRRQIYSFGIDPDLLAGIRAVKEVYGIPEAEQIRRGIRLWLESQGVKVMEPKEEEQLLQLVAQRQKELERKRRRRK